MSTVSPSIRIGICGSEPVALPPGRGKGIWPAGYASALQVAGAEPVFLDPQASEGWSDVCRDVHGMVLAGSARTTAGLAGRGGGALPLVPRPPAAAPGHRSWPARPQHHLWWQRLPRPGARAARGTPAPSSAGARPAARHQCPSRNPPGRALRRRRVRGQQRASPGGATAGTRLRGERPRPGWRHRSHRDGSRELVCAGSPVAAGVRDGVGAGHPTLPGTGGCVASAAADETKTPLAQTTTRDAGAERAGGRGVEVCT